MLFAVLVWMESYRINTNNVCLISVKALNNMTDCYLKVQRTSDRSFSEVLATLALSL